AREPVVTQMQVDTRRFDRTMTGLDLHGFEGHARLTQPRQARVAQLMAGASLQAGTSTCAGEDLINSLSRQWLSPPRLFQHGEQSIRGGHGPLVVEVVAHRREETISDRHHPLMTALAVCDEHTTFTNPQIL